MIGRGQLGPGLLRTPNRLRFLVRLTLFSTASISYGAFVWIPSVPSFGSVSVVSPSALVLCRRIVCIRFWACLASGSVTWAVCRRPLCQPPTSCPPTLYFSFSFYPPCESFPCISSFLPLLGGLSRSRAIGGMQYVRSISGSVSKTWNSINPATLSGAIDVIVIEQEDGISFCELLLVNRDG